MEFMLWIERTIFVAKLFEKTSVELLFKNVEKLKKVYFFFLLPPKTFDTSKQHCRFCATYIYSNELYFN